MKRSVTLSAACVMTALLTAACASKADQGANGTSTSPAGSGASTSSSASSGSSDAVFRAKPVDGSANGAKIALISFANNPFWAPVQKGAEAAKTLLESKGATVNYIIAGTTLDATTVDSAIQAAAAQGYKAIGVVPLADGTCPTIKDAVSQHIVVATFVAEGSCSQQAGSLFFHGQEGTAAGKEAADAMAKAIDCKGSVGVITGSFAVQQHENRRKGFVDELKAKCPSVKLVGPVQNGDDAGKALSEANDFMSAHADLSGIYVTAGGPFGAGLGRCLGDDDRQTGEAVKQAAKTGKVHIVSYDFVPQTVDLVRSGVIDATIGQDPFGESYNTAIMLFNNLVNGSKPGQYFVPVTAQVMTRDNIDQVLASQGGS